MQQGCKAGDSGGAGMQRERGGEARKNRVQLSERVSPRQVELRASARAPASNWCLTCSRELFFRSLSLCGLFRGTIQGLEAKEPVYTAKAWVF